LGARGVADDDVRLARLVVVVEVITAPFAGRSDGGVAARETSSRG